MSILISVKGLLQFSLLALLFSSHGTIQSKNYAAYVKRNKNFTVGLLPYKGFDSSLLNFLKGETEEFYHCKVILLKPVSIPSFSFYAPRNRYKADSLLVYESQMNLNNIDAIAGLTNKDISTSKDAIPDWGVFGLGLCPGKACVISTYRFQKSSKSLTQLKERLIKVVLHELGHNLGLPHCSVDPECLMNDAGGTIKQVDKEKKWLCDKCRQKLDK